MSKEINLKELTAKEKIALLKKQLAEKANRENEVIPLSHGQSALFFLYLNSPESSAYNVSFTARIISPVNLNLLKKSFQILLNQNESLRTRFYIKEGSPVQEILGYEEISFEEINCEGLSEKELKSKCIQVYRIPFDLEHGPVFRVYIFRVSERNHVLMMKMHHICCDGWSLGILLNELKNIYESVSEGKEAHFIQPKVKYSDYINSQEEIINSSKGKEHLLYWENELSGEASILNLHSGKPRPAMQTFSGVSEYFTVDNKLSFKLKELSKKEGTTLFVTLLSAYQILLHFYTSQTEIITGTPTAGRYKSEFDNMTGYFINPVAIKGMFSSGITFREFIQQIKKKVIGALSHQEIPFQVIVEKILKSRDPSRSPVFQAFFAMQGIPKGREIQELIVPGNKGVKVKFGDLEIESFDIPQQEGQFDLMLEFFEGGNIFTGVLKYNNDVFESGLIKQMSGHLCNLLQDIADNPEKPVSDLSILSDSEKNKILKEWNNTAVEYDTSLLIHELFSAQAKATPDLTAAEIGNESITYAELDAVTNMLAILLIKKGVVPDTLVGVYLDRSFEMIISLLAILKAGGAYVPVDPSYPKERVDYMLDDSQVKIVLSREIFRSGISDFKNEVIFTDEFSKVSGTESSSIPEVSLSAGNLAYMIYTSGSTGKPKGAMNTHGGILNRLLWMKDYLGITSSDNIFQKTSFSFDVSVWEFFLPLISGAKLVFAKPEGHKDTSYLAEEIINKNITIMHFVPSMLQVFLEEGKAQECISLKKVICSGEELTKPLQDQFFRIFKNTELHNLYGPTEAAVDVSYWKCEKESKLNFVPIGKPVDNTQIYILNPYLKNVPEGIPGELHIGGVQVAKGYFNREELTSEKFIPDIFSGKENAKMYKTGDLVRYMPDGNIEYLGRLDNQIKIRGFRIELGEIESVLNRMEGIREAVVIAKEIRQGDKRIIAFLVKDEEEKATLNDVRKYLKEILPEYMIPSQITFIDKIPLSQNGKADRKALTTVEFSRDELHTEFKSASNPAEEILVKIWKEALSLDKVGVNDNFFELGGDSIISIQIIFKANKEGLKITPKQIFQFQTISELASVIDTSIENTAQQDIVTGEVNLTPVQHWFFEQNLPEPDHFNHSVLLHVPKYLKTGSLNSAAEELIKHHDALRLSFTKKDSGWKQYNEDYSDNTVFSTADFTGSDAENIREKLDNDIKEMQRTLNLSSGHLIKIRHYKMPESTDDRLLIIVHHLCIDGISWRILLEDLYTAYSQSSSGNKIELSDKTESFKEWSRKLKAYSDSDKIKEQLKHWISLSGTDADEIPVDDNSTEDSASSEMSVRAELDSENTNLLIKEVPKTYNTQINDILLTSLLTSYRKWSKKEKLFINLEGHGREEIPGTADISRTVGWFTSIFPVLLDSAVSDDKGDIIKSVKETLRRNPDGGISYGMLRYISEDALIKSEMLKIPEPEIVFNYLGQINKIINGDQEWKLGDRLIVLSRNENGKRKHKLEINSVLSDNCLKLDFTYSKNIFNKETIENFAQIYITELKEIISHCISTEAGGYTPSDFSAAGLDQQELDNLLANLK